MDRPLRIHIAVQSRFLCIPANQPRMAGIVSLVGRAGLRDEFVNVLSAMERHFREKNWTSTRFELFFNHKKRYKGFNWDGDEIRFERDNDYLVTYRRMVDKAVPADSPVKFVVRADTSWSMADQFERPPRNRELLGGWRGNPPVGIRTRRRRSGRVATSCGVTAERPPVDRVSSEITVNPLRSWVSGVQGFVRWLTVAPGRTVDVAARRR